MPAPPSNLTGAVVIPGVVPDWVKQTTQEYHDNRYLHFKTHCVPPLDKRHVTFRGVNKTLLEHSQPFLFKNLPIPVDYKGRTL